jgi:general secretion pathway protein I
MVMSRVDLKAVKNTMAVYSEPRKWAGFTLLEVMVAVAIIAIALVAVYRMYTQTIFMNSSARFYTLAPLLVQKKLADIDNQPISELSDESGDFGDDFPGYAWQLTVETLENEILDKDQGELKRLDIRVSLNDSEASYQLRTYRFGVP